MQQLKQNNFSGHQTGVGMIEVLVALFILAVGLLGVLAMQANGIKSNQRAGFSTEAQFLAQDMVDRIQAYNNIDITSDDDDYDAIDLTQDQIPSKPNCIATGCSEAQQKTLDTHEWGTELAKRLPGGVGKVEYDDDTAGDEKYVVTIFWDGNQDGSTGTDCTGGENQMLCYTLEFRL